MKVLVVLCLFLSMGFAARAAESTMKMNFVDQEIIKIIDSYSKASKQRFLLDPGVRGKITILIQEPISLDEAFAQLSNALAINGYAISKQGDTMVIQSARNVQRNLIEVTSDLPAIKPQRMVTWVYHCQNISAEDINRDLRILTSKDGEMSILAATNDVVITDWVTNLNRVAEIFKRVDVKPDPKQAAWPIHADRAHAVEHALKGSPKPTIAPE